MPDKPTTLKTFGTSILFDKKLHMRYYFFKGNKKCITSEKLQRFLTAINTYLQCPKHIYKNPLHTAVKVSSEMHYAVANCIHVPHRLGFFRLGDDCASLINKRPSKRLKNIQWWFYEDGSIIKRKKKAQEIWKSLRCSFYPWKAIRSYHNSIVSSFSDVLGSKLLLSNNVSSQQTLSTSGTYFRQNA